jgi:type II secretory pathway pseudopilin PulG
MRQHFSQRLDQRKTQAGMTLLELVIACGILMVLSSAALPLARVTVMRQREAELRRDLREMRDAIDRYKDAADKNLIRIEVGSQGYPPDLETLMTLRKLEPAPRPWPPSAARRRSARYRHPVRPRLLPLRRPRCDFFVRFQWIR